MELAEVKAELARAKGIAQTLRPEDRNEANPDYVMVMQIIDRTIGEFLVEDFDAASMTPEEHIEHYAELNQMLDSTGEDGSSLSRIEDGWDGFSPLVKMFAVIRLVLNVYDLPMGYPRPANYTRAVEIGGKVITRPPEVETS